MRFKQEVNVSNAPRSWPERYIQIAVMTDAGLPASRALDTVKRSLYQTDAKLERAMGLISRGKTFADSFKIAGILSSFDYTLIRNAELAGKLGLGLRHLADQRINQIQRVRSLRHSLLLPKFVLVIGCLAGVFIKTSVGGLSTPDAMLSVGLVLVIFFIISGFFERLLLSDVRRWLSWLWPITLIKKTSKRYQGLFEVVFFRNFIWQLNSGIDAQEAVKNCGNLLDSTDYVTKTRNAARELGGGNSLPQCLDQYGLVLSNRMRQVLKSAQESGRYQQAIEHEISLQQNKLNQQLDAQFKWLPRVYYLIVLIVLARSVLAF